MSLRTIVPATLLVALAIGAAQQPTPPRKHGGKGRQKTWNRPGPDRPGGGREPLIQTPGTADPGSTVAGTVDGDQGDLSPTLAHGLHPAKFKINLGKLVATSNGGYKTVLVQANLPVGTAQVDPQDPKHLIYPFSASIPSVPAPTTFIFYGKTNGGKKIAPSLTFVVP